MQSTVYGIPNCDQIRKTLAWFATKRIPVAFHVYKKAGISAELLRAWFARADWPVFVNRSGTTWRKLAEAERITITTADAAIALLVKQPAIIKRPVVARGDRLHVGFDPDALERLVAN